MHRINTSRQTLSSKQCNAHYRPSNEIAPHVLAATFHDERIKKPMIRCKATEAFSKGAVTVKVNETFYLVASKFISYFYVITQDGRCSSSDERVAQRCQAMVAAKAA